MPKRVIRAADLVRTPWKNGGGTTAEVAAFPPSADLDGFGWRISMADVASDGPFSVFPGIDRTLIVAEGDGIELTVEGVPYRLEGSGAKLSFSGDDSAAARLLSGPIRDLNVMTRRGRFRHRTRILESGVALLSEGLAAAFIVALGGSLDVTADGTVHALGPLDTLALGPAPDLIPLSGAGRAVLIEIESAAEADGSRA